jgi:urease accessory protein
MLLIQKKITTLTQLNIQHRKLDKLYLQWHETGKRLLHKTTENGTVVTLKFLNENPAFADGDVLFADDKTIIAISIVPCTCIVIVPDSHMALAALCYEIGNRHLPLFFDGQELQIPMDEPLYRLLCMQGYPAKTANRQLQQPLKTTVVPHLNFSNALAEKLSNASNINT